MADEIRVAAGLSFAKSGSSDRFDVSMTIDMSGSQYCKKTQTVGTSEENLVKGDVNTIGLVLIKNLDEDNFIEIGGNTGELPIKIGAGESAGPMRWNATNVIAKADTAPCIVEYLLIEA